ncbi:MAG: DNA polymerase/3'-5' exonuclease PolX [Vicinamibacteraceae bacterium]|nr:DNA polymerase/3'-5' exonuclease PolX [Vicinamibacteraceae bacterium]
MVAGPRRPDTNALVVSLLRDLAAVQTSRQKRWGYARAADAVAGLDAPIESYVRADGSLRKIPHVGPSSTRVILEVLATGASATVEEAVAGSGKAREVERSRGLRDTFLTRADVMKALRSRRRDVVSLDDYRGDLQMHSTYSDGKQSLEAIVETGLARGYEYAAVTDHSHGLPIARGVSMARLAEQHWAIDRLNRKYAGRFRLIKGIEANILADGSLDLTPAERRRVELVVAAPHSALRSASDQTGRMLAAVRAQGVHILGHPRGRKYGVRPGVTADWDRVFDAAARKTVAIEIDGDPRRQDIDHELARRALAAGCLFALDSDAHAVSEWEFAETAVAHARLAGIPAERVVNCWPVDFLLDWARGLSA